MMSLILILICILLVGIKCQDQGKKWLILQTSLPPSLSFLLFPPFTHPSFPLSLVPFSLPHFLSFPHFTPTPSPSFPLSCSAVVSIPIPQVVHMMLGDLRTLNCSIEPENWCFATLENGLTSFDQNTMTIQINGSEECPDHNNSYEDILPVCDETLVYCTSEGLCKNTSYLTQPFHIIIIDEECPSPEPTDMICPTSTPDMICPTSTPDMICPTSTPDMICPTSTPDMICPTSTPDMICPTSTSDMICPTSTPDMICPTSTPDMICPTSTSDMICPTSTPDMMCPTSTPDMMCPTSTPDMICPTSTPDMICPTSTPDMICPTSTPDTSPTPDHNCTDLAELMCPNSTIIDSGTIQECIELCCDISDQQSSLSKPSHHLLHSAIFIIVMIIGEALIGSII